jgi:predicted metal-dependent hydrolase
MKRMEYSIQTADGDLKFKLVRRKMKHIRIRVTGAQQVVVSVPHRCALSIVTEFVKKNEAFIRRQLAAMEAARSRHYPASYTDGDMFTYLGRRAVLRVRPAKRASAVFEGGVLTLSVLPGGCAKTQFIRWAAWEAQAVFAQRLAASAAAFSGADGLSVSAKRMLTRWGSINPAKGRLSLSVHLMRCETDLIDYVIAHELCHIGCMKHNARFYRALELHWPQRREMDRRLAAYGLVDF